MNIVRLIVLNGGEGDYDFIVGSVSLFGIVKKIKKNEQKDGAYIVFLEGNYEVDIVTDRVLVMTKI